MAGSTGINLCKLAAVFHHLHIRIFYFFPILIFTAFYIINMLLTGAMATFATYRHHAIGGMIGIFFKIIFFLQVGTVAGGTHGIPVLGIACPMQPVMRRNLLPCILMKPFFISEVPVPVSYTHLRA